MGGRTAQVVVCIAILAPSVDAGVQKKSAPHARQHKSAARRRAPAPPPLPCGDLLSFQVLLDRQGFSPGQIDSTPGVNFSRALVALQQARNVPATGQPDCDTWHALGGETAESTLARYTVTAEDLQGPFERIPSELVAQAKLPALGYQSLLELLAERFHVSPPLLQQLNRGGRLTDGREIRVPGVTPFDPNAKPAFDAAAADVTIEVSRDESALRATRADGTLVFFAPVTTGSGHDPLPLGNWTVTNVNWHPVFHYNPDLFWDANPKDAKTTIRAGPNNPAGVVWIALNLEHYGLHGTPEPGRIGHTESHGCVRMTNWDAVRVASLVRRGTPVLFR
jgi:lipoprotein-anchoring transpeptidase ErfK/SrfK